MEDRHPPADVVDSPPVQRAATQALMLLASALNVQVLRAHANGPLRLTELQGQTDWPSQSTLRATLRTLRDLGALATRRLPGAPYAVTNELTPAGNELLLLVDILRAWLDQAPDGPIDPDSNAAKAAVKALAAGWDSSIVTMLAAQPSRLTELAKAIPDVSYPSLERRLSRMRITGEVEPVATDGRGTPFAVSEWLRRSVGLLCGAARWEQRHMDERVVPRITDTEVRTALLLALPLPLPLPESAGGRCFLAVQGEAGASGEPSPPAGITAEVRRGEIVSSVAGIDQAPSSWALGTSETWLEALVDGRVETLRAGGAAPQLAIDLVRSIHFVLFDLLA